MKFAIPTGATALCLTISLPAHDGHDPVVVIGTVTRVATDGIAVQRLDAASSRIETVWIFVDQKTRYRVGKQRVEAPPPMTGLKIIVAADVEHEESRPTEVELRATEIRISEPKKAGVARR